MPNRAIALSAVALAGLTALTIAGCSSSGTVTHPIIKQSPIAILVPSPGSSGSAGIVESSDTVLQARLLKPSDLPAGWQRSTPATATTTSLSAGASCNAVGDPAYDHLPLHVEADYTDYTSGSGPLPLPRLTETLAYGDTAEVDAAWSAYVQAVTTCGHGRLTMRLAGQPRQLTLTQMPFPQTGDATDAREAVSTEGRAVSVCFVVFRKGNLLAAVTYAAWGPPDTSEVEHLVEGVDAATAGIR